MLFRSLDGLGSTLDGRLAVRCIKRGFRDRDDGRDFGHDGVEQRVGRDFGFKSRVGRRRGLGGSEGGQNDRGERREGRRNEGDFWRCVCEAMQ